VRSDAPIAATIRAGHGAAASGAPRAGRHGANRSAHESVDRDRQAFNVEVTYGSDTFRTGAGSVAA